MYHPAPRRSLDETSAPAPSARRRKTVSFTELPSRAFYAPSRPGHVPSYKRGEVPPPRASSLAPQHRRHGSEDHVLHIRPRPQPIVTAFATPQRAPAPAKRALTLDDAVAHSPWARRRDAEKGDPRLGEQVPAALSRAARVDTSVDSDASSLSTPPVDQPISLPLQRHDVAVPPSPATSASSFFSDSTIPYLPLPSPLRPQHFDAPPPSPELSPSQKAPEFSPAFASSLLFFLAMGTIVQEAATEGSRIFLALDLLVYYSLFAGALAVFGPPWLMAWSTIPFLIVAFDITSLRERHLVEFGPTDPQEDLTRLAAADSDTDSTPMSVEAKLARQRRVERAQWTPLPYLVLSGSLFLSCLLSLAAARLFHVRHFVWFNLGSVCFWLLGSFALERQYPQCKLYSRRKALFRKDDVESIAVRQALHRLAPAALIALTYYLLRAPASAL